MRKSNSAWIKDVEITNASYNIISLTSGFQHENTVGKCTMNGSQT